MKKRKVYICIATDLPNGLMRLRLEKAKENIEKVNDIPVMPLTEKGRRMKLGRQIDLMLCADLVYFGRGWQNSKECMAVFEVARVYEKKMMFE
jgi:hypothetical protein